MRKKYKEIILTTEETTENDWFEVNEKFRDLRQCGKIQPGMIIEMENGERYLVGDINCNGGICDDCMAFDWEDVVKRYIRIFQNYEE